MITLRILTMKSKLGVGTYQNETIERLIAAQRFRYLRHIYYTYEAIDFMDDVKEAIHITHPINKPGIAPELEAKNNEIMDAKMLDKHGYKATSHIRSQARKTEREARRSEYFGNTLSKGQMQAINQGKMKP